MKKNINWLIIAGVCILSVAVWGIIMVATPPAYESMDEVQMPHPADWPLRLDLEDEGSEETFNVVVTHRQVINDQITLFYASEIVDGPDDVELPDRKGIYFVYDWPIAYVISEQEARELLKEAE